MTQAFADTDIQLCTACFAWHSAPVPCSHDPFRRCRCGGVVGYRFTLDDGTLSDGRRCARCCWAEVA